MSTHATDKRISVTDIQAMKGPKGPIVSLTAYTFLTAKFLDDTVDLLLVGDSLGMVLYGLDSTLGVTLDMMIAHGQAVMRGSNRACVIVDMPFGSYQESPEVAFRNAARVMKEVRCAGIKLEGGAEMADTVRFLVQRGIPVLGHIGLMPQSVNAAGGFRSHGRTAAEAAAILNDAKAIADAGAFAIVIEGTVEPLAAKITKTIDVPTIGIGASPECDGQILVTEDLVGLYTEFKPKFAKRYSELGAGIAAAGREFAADVRAGRFPAKEHCFGVAGKKTAKKKAASKTKAKTKKKATAKRKR